MFSPPSKETPAKSTASKEQTSPAFIIGPNLRRIEKDQDRGLKASRQVASDCDQVVQHSQEELCQTIVLQLENGGVDWRRIQGWTEYLFSAGPSGHEAIREAKRENDEAVRAAEEELDAIIKQVLEEEAAYSAEQEKKLVHCRLIVSNIAAGADVDEVALFFSEFKYDL